MSTTNTEQPRALTLDDLVAACRPGGASVLTSTCALRPAAGWSALVAPPRYLDRSEAVYSFAMRAVDGTAVQTVLIDSKGSQANRRETGVAAAMTDETHEAHAVVRRIPRLVLEVPAAGGRPGMRLLDLELPHRWVDGHVRTGSRNGASVTRDPQYRAMRDATPADVSAIFNLSPLSLIDGVWDASRKSNQVRLRSAIVGEIFGVLADQEGGPASVARRGGARIDPVAASVQLDGRAIMAIADRQKDELSSKKYKEIENKAKKAEKVKNSGSVLGLGAVPPSLSALGGVSCTQITKSTVLSFAALRQLRFGGSREQDVAFRALLAAIALLSMALADQELYLRADCDLTEEAPSEVVLDGRYGIRTAVSPIDVDAAIALVDAALANADEHGLAWDGQEFVVEGDGSILAAAVDDDAEGDE